MPELAELTAQELHTVARSQKRLIYLLLAIIALSIAGLLVQAQAVPGEELSGNATRLLVAISLVQVFMFIFAMAALWMVLRTTGSTIAVCVAAVIGLLIGMVIPIVTLIVLVLASVRATRELRAAGYEVGFLGAKGETMQRLRAAAEGVRRESGAEPPPVSRTNE